MGEKPARRRPNIARAVLAYLLTAAVTAGLGYLMYVFFRVPFFPGWLRWTLILSDAVLIVFCLGVLPRLAKDR